MTELTWPLGRAGDRVLVVQWEDAELLAPILSGESEPEDFGTERVVILGIPNLDIAPEQLAEELAGGPDDVWLVFPRSDAAYGFHEALSEAMHSSGRVPPANALLPTPVTVEQLIGALPSGRNALSPDHPSRWRLLLGALHLCWVADAPDQGLAPLVLGQASARYHDLVL
jgi:hypothetical protein